MSTPNKYVPDANVPPPRCPYCSTDLATVGTFQWTNQTAIGLGVMLCMFCPNSECRKIIGTQIILIPYAQESSSIVGPH